MSRSNVEVFILESQTELLPVQLGATSGYYRKDIPLNCLADHIVNSVQILKIWNYLKCFKRGLDGYKSFILWNLRPFRQALVMICYAKIFSVHSAVLEQLVKVGTK